MHPIELLQADAWKVASCGQVEEADLGSNFFLDEASLGKPRAECVTQMLRELNEHVAGSYVNEDIADVLEARPDFLTPFTLVIATQLPARELKRVGELCAARQIALVVAQTYGFMGYLRLMLNEHEVVEAHPAHPFSSLESVFGRVAVLVRREKWFHSPV